MFQVVEFIKYFIKAKGKHSIHSPFVYEFVTKCLTTKLKKKSIQKIQTYEKAFLSNKNSISVNDLGAGSRLLGKKRTIQAIRKTSGSKKRYALLLYQLMNFYKPKYVLELGTNLGIGTIHLALGNENSTILSIEGDENLAKLAKQELNNVYVENAQIINSSFLSFLTDYKGPKFDFVFVDGHHDGLALINYLKTLDNHTHNNTIFLLDDIRWSKNMFEAWKKLKNDSVYHVSIDLFKMGILIKRSEQVKEHFVIRLKNIILSL